MNVKALIKQTKFLQNEVAASTIVINENKAKIQEFFDKKGLKTIEVEAEKLDKGDIPLVAIKIEKCFVQYYMDKLQKKVSKELFEKIVLKHYEITDMQNLVILLQQAGVSPKDFKQYIKISMNPNKEALKQAYSMGEITKKDLEGCYTFRIEKSIQIKEKK